VTPRKSSVDNCLERLAAISLHNQEKSPRSRTTQAFSSWTTSWSVVDSHSLCLWEAKGRAHHFVTAISPATLIDRVTSGCQP